MNKKTITITVDVEQTNLILEGLGLLPFVRVYELIGAIQEQARRQLADAPTPRPAVPEQSPPESASQPRIVAEEHAG